jgi:hypothetical protein
MKHPSNINDHDLAARLRNEAIENSPAFSPLLHARIMQRIASHDGAADAGPIHRPRSPWLQFAALAAAASIALLLMLHFRPAQVSVSHIVDPTAVHPMPPHVPVPQFALVTNIGTFPGLEQLDDARYAYLDKDARHLAQFMMHQMDVLPGNRSDNR